MENMSWAQREHAGELQVPITLDMKEDDSKKVYRKPLTDSITGMIENRDSKERGQKGQSFKNRKKEEYIFDNEDEYEITTNASAPAPFPDIAAKVPGILTKWEEMMGVDEVIKRKPKPSNEQQAMFAAPN
jgi:hypothetical protein